MEIGNENKREFSVVPLQNAVFCVDCESVSNSPNDKCLVCGSHSLFGLFRMLGGTLWNRKIDNDEREKGVRYDLEITVEINGMTAKDLNQIIASISRLIEPNTGVWKGFHINVDSLLDDGSGSEPKAA